MKKTDKHWPNPGGTLKGVPPTSCPHDAGSDYGLALTLANRLVALGEALSVGR